jgi:2-octaprenylphenol hydroxylase
MNTNVDVVIVGGGLVGATLAALLASKTSLSIAIIDKQALPQYTPPDHRVSAVVPSSIHLFKAIKAWGAMQATCVSPYQRMAVWDGQSSGYVSFEAANQLGFIIENSLMQTAVHEVLAEQASVQRFMAVEPESYQATDDGVTIQLKNGNHITAKLAVAADGAHSWLRAAAGIAVKKTPSDECAIVATVTTEKPHEATARQIFLKTGPLAFLPLTDAHASSIVWSLPNALADSYLSLDDTAFAKVLAAAFEQRLGAVLSVTSRHRLPLQPQQALAYVQPGLALVGDAAHTMHPLAGLGVNLGLMDAASLADVLVKAVKAGEPLGDYRVLRRYARWRAAENLPILTGVDAIKRCFALDQPAFSVLRGLGMTLTERCAWVKKAFIEIASLNYPR